MTLFILEDDSLPADLLTDFLFEVEEMVIVKIILEVVHTRDEFIMWASL